MNITLETQARAQDALDFLQQNPQNHNQKDYLTGHMREHAFPESNLCGTTMCVAGTVSWQHQGYVGWDAFMEAMELLGLEYHEAESLFYTADESDALDLLTAIANGDQAKFDAIAPFTTKLA